MRIGPVKIASIDGIATLTIPQEILVLREEMNPFTEDKKVEYFAGYSNREIPKS